MDVWSQRRLAKQVRMQLRELSALHAEVQQVSETLAAVEADGDRADQQRERGDAWSELADAMDSAVQEVTDSLDAVESTLA